MSKQKRFPLLSRKSQGYGKKIRQVKLPTEEFSTKDFARMERQAKRAMEANRKKLAK